MIKCGNNVKCDVSNVKFEENNAKFEISNVKIEVNNAKFNIYNAKFGINNAKFDTLNAIVGVCCQDVGVFRKNHLHLSLRTERSEAKNYKK
jgi:hypothetical protein